MDSTSDWKPFTDDANSGNLSTIRFTEAYDDAIQLEFNLVRNGYVGISRMLESGLPSEFDGISFRYKGDGAPNTIEFMLLYEPGSDGESTRFSKTLDQRTTANEWRTLEVLYSEFGCWPETGCSLGKQIDPEKVWAVNFAISNKPGNRPGIGFVTIDDVRGIPAR